MGCKVDVKNVCSYLHISTLVICISDFALFATLLKGGKNQIIFHLSSLHSTSNNLGYVCSLCCQ